MRVEALRLTATPRLSSGGGADPLKERMAGALRQTREMHLKRTMTSGVDYTFHFMEHMFSVSQRTLQANSRC